MSHSERPGTNQVPNPALGRRYYDGQLSRKGKENETDKIYKHLLYMVCKIFDNLKTAYLYSFISFHCRIISQSRSTAEVVHGMCFKMSRSRFTSEICNLLFTTLGNVCNFPKSQVLNLLNVVNNWNRGNDARKTFRMGSSRYQV